MDAFFPSYDRDEIVNELIREHAKQKAQFCLATGIAPSEYEQLTQIEINAFIHEANRRAKKGAQ